MPKQIEPTFQGYSIGKWIDADGDRRLDLLAWRSDCSTSVVSDALAAGRLVVPSSITAETGEARYAAIPT
jgi:hypothetical protein